MMTKTYAVIGDPIDHSFSPALHNTAFLFLGLDCTYIAYRIPKGELEFGIRGIKENWHSRIQCHNTPQS